MKNKSHSLFRLARSLRAPEMKDAVVDEFVATRASLAYLMACVSDLLGDAVARLQRGRGIRSALVW